MQRHPIGDLGRRDLVTQDFDAFADLPKSCLELLGDQRFIEPTGRRWHCRGGYQVVSLDSRQAEGHFDSSLPPSSRSESHRRAFFGWAGARQAEMRRTLDVHEAASVNHSVTIAVASDRFRTSVVGR